MNKNLKKALVFFVTFLFTAQSFLPIMALAENEKVTGVLLETFKVISESEEEIATEITAHVTNVTEVDEKFEILLNEGIAATVSSTSGAVQEDVAIENGNKLLINSRAQSQSALKIKLSIRRDSVEGLSELSASTISQKITVPLEMKKYEIESSDISEMDTSTTASSEEKEIVKEQPVVKQQMQRNVVDQPSSLEMILELNGSKFNGIPIINENDTFTFRLGYQAGSTDLIGKTVPIIFPEELELPDSILKVPAGNENIESITRDPNNPQKINIKFKDSTINSNGEFTISGKYHLTQKEKNEERHLSWSLDGDEGTVTIIEKVPGSKIPSTNYKNRTKKNVENGNKYAITQDEKGKVTITENKQANVKYKLNWETAEGVTGGTITDEIDSRWNINSDVSKIKAKVTTTTVMDELNEVTETKEYPLDASNIVIVDNKLTLTNINLPANSKLELNYTAFMTESGKEELIKEAEKELETKDQGNYVVKNIAKFNDKEETGQFSIGYSKATKPGVIDPNQENTWDIINKTVDQDFMKHRLTDDGYFIDEADKPTTVDLNYQVDINLNKFKTEGTNALKENTVLVDILPTNIEYQISALNVMQGDKSIGKDVSSQYQEIHDGDMITELAKAPVFSYALKNGRLYVNVGKDKNQSYQLKMTLKVSRMINGQYVGKYNRPTWSIRNWAILHDGPNQYPTYVDTGIEKKETVTPPVKEDKAFKKNAKSNIQIEKGEAATIDYAFEINGWDKPISRMDDFELIDWVNLDYFDESELLNAKLSGELGWGERELADLLTLSLGDKNENNEQQLIIRPNDKFKELAAGFQDGKRMKINLSLKTKVFDKKVLLDIKNTATFNVKGHEEVYTSTKETEVNSFGDEMALDKQVASMDEQVFKKSLNLDMKEKNSDDIVVYQIKLLPNGGYTGAFGFEVIDELPKEIEFLGFVPENNLFTSLPTEKNKLSEIKLLDKSGKYQAVYDNNEIKISNSKGNNIQGKETSVYFYARVKSYEKDQPIINSLKNTDVEATVVPKVVSLPITKIWEDYDNHFNTRPDSIKVALLQNEKEFKEIELSGQDNEWTYNFTNLPQQDALGNDYRYTVQEIKVPENYTSKVEGTTITNTYVNKDTVEVPVTKIWEDYSNQFNTRPENITVELLKNGKSEMVQELKGDSDKWSYTFKNLPKYDNKGKEYSYSVKEIKVPENYTSKVEGTTITNTYVNKETTELPVTKIWEDYSNQFKTRPENITVELLKNGESEKVEEIKGNSDKWIYTFKDLPKYDNKGKEYSYSVKEIKVPENYTSKVEGTTITNTYVNKETTELPVTKIWNDYSNQFKTRPESITVELLKNGEVVATEKVTGDSDKWSYTFKDLPKYDNKGKEYSYSVKEIKVPSNYTNKVEGTTITNTYVNKETTELPVTKIWEDYSNQFNTRPETITIELLKNGESEKVEEIKGDSDKWEYTFKNLPKYDNKGKEYSYSVKEIKVPSNYTSKVEGTTITNTYVNKETTELPVTKIWNDYSNQFKTRPESITVELLKNGEVVATEKVTGDSDKWSYTFKGLPKYDNKGKEFSYSVKEIKVPSNYTSKVEGTTITNTYVNKETTELPVTKIWNDYSNQFNTRPKSITVELLKNDEVVATEKVTGKTNTWNYTFKGLAKYDNKGKEYSYSVKEIKVPENYTSKVEGTTITNTYVNKETTELPVTKIWNDYSNQFNTRPKNITIELLKNGKSEVVQELTGDSDKWSYTFKDLPKYDNKGKEFSYSVKEIKVPSNYTSKVEGTTITNTYVNKETTELPVTKIWNDYSNQFNTRPKNITIELLKNGKSEVVQELTGDSDKWEYTFKNLPKYDNKGKEYSYSVKEIKVPSNYTSKVEGTTITNTYVNKETTELPVTKIWNDYSNQFKTRPESITVELLKNGEVVATEKVTGDSDKWSYTFKDLPKYDNKGKEFSYSMKEIKVSSNYTSKVEGTTITNTYINKETTELPVTKIWEDYSNKFNTRPETITIELFKNGESEKVEEIKGDSDKWEYTFKNLPKYDNKGKEYCYSVKEIKVPENYTNKVEGTTITNTYVNKETIEIPVTKVWEDNNNQLNTRPENITVELLKNDEVVATEKVTGDSDKWEYIFKDLPKYDESGEAFRYSVKEIDVPEGYDSQVEGFTITNKLTKKEIVPEKPSVPSKPAEPSSEEKVPEKPKAPSSKEEVPTKSTESPSKVKVTNNQTTGKKLPQTNDQSNYVWVMIGLMLITVVFSIRYYKKEKQTN